jgi:hypothetical protein
MAVTFIKTEEQEVYDMLVNNQRLQTALDKDNLILKREMLYENYAPDQIDSMEVSIMLDNMIAFQELSRLLLANEKYLLETSIYLLTENKFLYKEISAIFGDMLISIDTYREIYYCYKYCYVSSFFQNNLKYFIPEYDYEQIEQDDLTVAFLDAMMKEYDKMDYTMTQLVRYQRMDEIPFEHINYLSQLLGFETKDVYEENEVIFKTLLKNIIEIFKIKGTKYLFEMFFAFLGIGLEIREFYFDRRYYYSPGAQELEGAMSDEYKYYLTTKNPVLNTLRKVARSETVNMADISPQYSMYEFDDLADKYGPEAVLGYSTVDKEGKLYTGKVYKYFKTNYVYFNVKFGREFTTDDIKMVNKYFELFTPAFITKIIAYEGLTRNMEDTIDDREGGYRKEDGEWVSREQEFMFDSYDTLLYNDDLEHGRASYVNGKMIFPNDLEVPYSIRVPISSKIYYDYINKYFGRDASPKIRFKRLANYYNKDANKWHIEIPPFATLNALGQNQLIYWEFDLDRSTRTHMDGAERVFTDINGNQVENISGNIINANNVSLKKDVKKLNAFREVDFTTTLPIADFINTPLFNEVTYKRVTNYDFLFVENVYPSLYQDLTVKLELLEDNYHFAYVYNDLASFRESEYNKFKDQYKNFYDYCYVAVLGPVYISVYQYVASLDTFQWTMIKSHTGFGLKFDYNGNPVIGEYSDTDYGINVDASGNKILKKNDPTYGDRGYIPVSNRLKTFVYLDEAFEYLHNVEMKNNIKTGDLIQLTSTMEYYIVVRKAIPTQFTLFEHYGRNYNFTTLDEAVHYFDTSLNDEKYNGVEFFVFDEYEDYDNSLYRYGYTNRLIGTSIYSIADEKYYELKNGIRDDQVVETKFYGNLKVENGKAIIYDYDLYYNSYDEYADYDDFILYNREYEITRNADSNNIFVTWPENNTTNYQKFKKEFADQYNTKHKVKFGYLDTYIHRPIYELIKRDLLADAEKMTWFVRRLANQTVEHFSDSELYKRSEIEEPDTPLSVSAIIEHYVEHLETTADNTLLEYYAEISNFFADYYRYVICQLPLPNDPHLQAIFNVTNYTAAINNIIVLVRQFIVEKEAYVTNSINIRLAASGDANAASQLNDQSPILTPDQLLPDHPYLNANNQQTYKDRFKTYFHVMRDAYREYTSKYHEFLDLCINLVSADSQDFLARYFYKELLLRYREKYFDDTGFVYNSLDAKPAFITKPVKAIMNGNFGTMRQNYTTERSNGYLKSYKAQIVGFTILREDKKLKLYVKAADMIHAMQMKFDLDLLEETLKMVPPLYRDVYRVELTNSYKRTIRVIVPTITNFDFTNYRDLKAHLEQELPIFDIVYKPTGDYYELIVECDTFGETTTEYAFVEESISFAPYIGFIRLNYYKNNFQDNDISYISAEAHKWVQRVGATVQDFLSYGTDRNVKATSTNAKVQESSYKTQLQLYQNGQPVVDGFVDYTQETKFDGKEISMTTNDFYDANIEEFTLLYDIIYLDLMAQHTKNKVYVFNKFSVGFTTVLEEVVKVITTQKTNILKRFFVQADNINLEIGPLILKKIWSIRIREIIQLIARETFNQLIFFAENREKILATLEGAPNLIFTWIQSLAANIKFGREKHNQGLYLTQDETITIASTLAWKLIPVFKDNNEMFETRIMLPKYNKPVEVYAIYDEENNNVSYDTLSYLYFDQEEMTMFELMMESSTYPFWKNSAANFTQFDYTGKEFLEYKNNEKYNICLYLSRNTIGKTDINSFNANYNALGTALTALNTALNATGLSYENLVTNIETKLLTVYGYVGASIYDISIRLLDDEAEYYATENKNNALKIVALKGNISEMISDNIIKDLERLENQFNLTYLVIESATSDLNSFIANNVFSTATSVASLALINALLDRLMELQSTIIMVNYSNTTNLKNLVKVIDGYAVFNATLEGIITSVITTAEEQYANISTAFATLKTDLEAATANVEANAEIADSAYLVSGARDSIEGTAEETEENIASYTKYFENIPTYIDKIKILQTNTEANLVLISQIGATKLSVNNIASYFNTIYVNSTNMHTIYMNMKSTRIYLDNTALINTTNAYINAIETNGNLINYEIARSGLINVKGNIDNTFSYFDGALALIANNSSLQTTLNSIKNYSDYNGYMDAAALNNIAYNGTTDAGLQATYRAAIVEAFRNAMASLQGKITAAKSLTVPVVKSVTANTGIINSNIASIRTVTSAVYTVLNNFNGVLTLTVQNKDSELSYWNSFGWITGTVCYRADDDSLVVIDEAAGTISSLGGASGNLYVESVQFVRNYVDYQTQKNSICYILFEDEEGLGTSRQYQNNVFILREASDVSFDISFIFTKQIYDRTNVAASSGVISFRKGFEGIDPVSEIVIEGNMRVV